VGATLNPKVIPDKVTESAGDLAIYEYGLDHDEKHLPIYYHSMVKMYEEISSNTDYMLDRY